MFNNFLGPFICLLLVGLAKMSPAEERQLADDNCNCGQVTSTRIIGGEEAGQGEVPWRVSMLTVRRGSNSGSACGGTIIDRNWLLTAAHCVDLPKGQEAGYDIYISAGSNTQLDQRKGQFIKVDGTMVKKHDGWNSQTIDNDIALVRISGSGFNFTNPNIVRCCLPYRFAQTVLKGKQVLASGWGQTTNTAGSTSKILLKALLNYFEYQECNQKLQQSRISNRIDANKVCTRTPNKDICQGDSGGSLDFLDGRYYAVGINSYVMGKCANENAVSVMTKISQYLKWIEDNTNVQYCKN